MRASTMQALVLALLQQPEGVTIEAVTQASGDTGDRMAAAFGRGFFSAVVHKKLGLALAAEKVDGSPPPRERACGSAASPSSAVR